MVNWRDYNPMDKAARAMKGEPEPVKTTTPKPHDSGKVNMSEEVKGAVRRQKAYEQDTMRTDRPEIRKTSRKRTYKK